MRLELIGETVERVFLVLLELVQIIIEENCRVLVFLVLFELVQLLLRRTGDYRCLSWCKLLLRRTVECESSWCCLG